jgi:tetratricopeptide (TPR) repeat protein
LYAIVEGPRYQDLSDSEDFQDAEYRLGLALSRGGGVSSARRYFARALARGPKAPFYEAALRGYVDVCLSAHVLPECAAELDRLGAEDEHQEIAYLRGRAAFDAGQEGEAEDELKQVTPESRFYSSALYLRGVARVKRGDFHGAEDAFCAIADVKDGDTLRFYIDGRYYALRDLARLALGRLAHEEGRYDDAFYHYFLIPQDSKKLPEALFEAAWSSLQRKDYDLGARLVAEFLKEFPHSPKASEARLLLATLEVKTCRFDDALKGFDTFLKENEPLAGEIDRALADPELRQALALRLLARDQQTEVQPGDKEGRLAEMLDVDQRFFRLQALAHGLGEEALDAGHVTQEWALLSARIAGTKVQAISSTLDAGALREQTRALGVELDRARRELRERGARATSEERAALEQSLSGLAARRRALEAALDRALGQTHAQGAEVEPPQGAGALLPMVRADADHAIRLSERTAQLTAELDKASGELVRKALVDLRGRLDDLLRRARLGKIDAVVGSKRNLEKQIEDLAAGRFPPEMYGRLHIEGLIGDDEEYWPPEPEIWLDEYENYK